MEEGNSEQAEAETLSGTAKQAAEIVGYLEHRARSAGCRTLAVFKGAGLDSECGENL